MSVLPLLLIVLAVSAYIVARWIENRGSIAPENDEKKPSELLRYQALKNMRRWGGRKLSASDQTELDRLRVKYWWLP